VVTPRQLVWLPFSCLPGPLGLSSRANSVTVAHIYPDTQGHLISRGDITLPYGPQQPSGSPPAKKRPRTQTLEPAATRREQQLTWMVPKHYRLLWSSSNAAVGSKNPTREPPTSVELPSRREDHRHTGLSKRRAMK
jgi:hypothetical protein